MLRIEIKAPIRPDLRGLFTSAGGTIDGDGPQTLAAIFKDEAGQYVLQGMGTKIDLKPHEAQALISDLLIKRDASAIQLPWFLSDIKSKIVVGEEIEYPVDFLPSAKTISESLIPFLQNFMDDNVRTPPNSGGIEVAKLSAPAIKAKATRDEGTSITTLRITTEPFDPKTPLSYGQSLGFVRAKPADTVCP